MLYRQFGKVIVILKPEECEHARGMQTCWTSALQPCQLLPHEYTAGIISLLTHICICVVLNTLVHAQLTYGHQSPCH